MKIWDNGVIRDMTPEEEQLFYEAHEQSEPHPTAEEALTRYTNELTGENDPDLVSATESLIIKFTEE